MDIKKILGGGNGDGENFQALLVNLIPKENITLEDIRPLINKVGIEYIVDLLHRSINLDISIVSFGGISLEELEKLNVSVNNLEELLNDETNGLGKLIVELLIWEYSPEENNFNDLKDKYTKKINKTIDPNKNNGSKENKPVSLFKENVPNYSNIKYFILNGIILFYDEEKEEILKDDDERILGFLNKIEGTKSKLKRVPDYQDIAYLEIQGIYVFYDTKRKYFIGEKNPFLSYSELLKNIESHNTPRE